MPPLGEHPHNDRDGHERLKRSEGSGRMSPVLLAGFIIGSAALLPLSVTLNIALSPLLAGGFILFVMAATCIGFAILFAIEHHAPWVTTLAKFGTVGAMNSFLEMAIVNALLLINGGALGIWFVGYKIASFMVASANAYLWNKRWTFDMQTPWSLPEYASFLSANLVGVFLNVGTSFLLIFFIPRPERVSIYVWTNAILVIAILVAMTWNFISQRRILTAAKDPVCSTQ